MLKIKDDIDLKELINKLDKKYQFKEIVENKQYYFLIEFENKYRERDYRGRGFVVTEELGWQIWKDTKEIRYLGTEKCKYVEGLGIRISYSVNDELDFVYDLMKDGLLEKMKVEE